MKNYYISKMGVLISNMLYRLMEYGYLDENDYDMSHDTFIRYVANIRFMLDEFHIYHISIVYDRDNKRYYLRKGVESL